MARDHFGGNDVNIFQYDAVTIPVQLPGHWTIVVLDIKRAEIKYLDSFQPNQTNYTVVARIREFLRCEAAKWKFSVSSKWPCIAEFSLRDFPIQANKADCGVFICMKDSHWYKIIVVDMYPTDTSNFQTKPGRFISYS
ncbi:sentrin-specific protease 2-like [Corticium candelabrum]|uniref:sentrin-specific protease 2-like n=1 Tax=Corticium candelabrum TaxID=121492 RepID=UPI002E27742B|nr:sentrin-specific protease 2-like [Corticium candelabrum]